MRITCSKGFYVLKKKQFRNPKEQTWNISDLCFHKFVTVKAKRGS